MPLFPDLGAAEVAWRRCYSKCTFCYQLDDVGRPPSLYPFSRHIFGPEKKEADLGSDTLMCGFREEEDAQKVPKNDD